MTENAPEETGETIAATETEATEATSSADELRSRVAELEHQIEQERTAATDYMQRWQRAQADFANYKRRSQQERDQQDRLLLAAAVAPVLNALDSFERAFNTLPPTLKGFTWIDGISLVDLQLRGALRQMGIAAIDVAPGMPFDPARHQAIGEVESAEYPAGHVAIVLQQGYMLDEFLLRPALVQIARTPEQTPAPEDAEKSSSGESSEAGPAP